MAADRALDAVGVRGASGGRGYCWPPAAPPHQQVPTWGRPIHEVGAVGRSGGQVERIGGSMPGREGATTSLSLLHSSPSSSSCGGASRGCISSGALYLARSTRRGIASPHHTFPPEPGIQSLQSGRYQQWSCGKGGKNYTAKASMLPHREGSCLCQFWEFQNFLQNWHLLELKLKLLALKRISNLVLCKLFFPDRYIHH